MNLKSLIRGIMSVSLVGSATLAPGALAEDERHIQRPVQQSRPMLDVVFVIDTTSSMGGLLEGAKQKVWSIASRMASGKPSPRVRVGLVAYRDQGDAYVSRVFPLSEDLDAVYQQLASLRAEGGGDSPEAVQVGLADAVDKQAWSEGQRVAKMIFVVGDQPAHSQDELALYAASRRAIQRGIVVNAIRCGVDPSAEAQFREVARLADGRFDSIDQSGGVVASSTPFDSDLSRLNGLLMDTALYAGRRDAIARGEARRAEAKALSAPASADRLSFMEKKAGIGGGFGAAAAGASGLGALDLTEAPARAAELADDELPQQLRALSKPERVRVAQDLHRRRAQLEREIGLVAKKRDEFLAAQAKAQGNSFDARVFEAVKRSAAKAGVAY